MDGKLAELIDGAANEVGDPPSERFGTLSSEAAAIAGLEVPVSGLKQTYRPRPKSTASLCFSVSLSLCVAYLFSTVQYSQPP
eukprot:COSAG03_NODE_1415_length_4115_cov_1.646165_5_plen_82_part_00